MKAGKRLQTGEGLAAIRIRLGLSQEALAIELGVSKSTLSKAENGRRSLSTAALIKLGTLENCLAPADTGAARGSQALPEAPAYHAGNGRRYRELAERCRFSAARLQFQLDIMKDKWELICRKIGEVKATIENNDAFGHLLSPYPLQYRLAKLQQQETACGPAAQEKIQRSIAQLKSETELHETAAQKAAPALYDPPGEPPG